MTYLLQQPVAYIAYVLGLVLVWVIVLPDRAIRLVRVVTLATSLFVLFVGLIACIAFDKNTAGFQFTNTLSTISQYNLSFSLGVDGLSMVFLLLTLFTFPILFLAAWNVTQASKRFFSFLLAIELILVLTFTTTDLVYFFVLFECLLIPMFLMIGIWGARDRKIKAAYYFFLYTLFGSLFMLFGIFYLYSITGSTSYTVIMNSRLGLEEQTVIWFCFFMAFAVKMPLFPFHIWLPEAHVEAPTVGSMLLASLLLKLGGYGFLRFSLTCLHEASEKYSAFVSVICVLGVVLGALATIRQIDLKRIIAYSSVSHMNLVTLGLFSNSQQGVEGAVYLMVAHGVVSTALFFCVGVLYDRHHSRLLRYYGGVALVMPLFATLFLTFSLANMGFPGTANFPGELAVFQGIYNKNTFVAILASTAIVLGAVYSTWLYNRVSFGALKVKYISEFTDLTRREFVVLFVLFIWMMILGLCTGPMLEIFRHAVLFPPVPLEAPELWTPERAWEEYVKMLFQNYREMAVELSELFPEYFDDANREAYQRMKAYDAAQTAKNVTLQPHPLQPARTTFHTIEP